MYRSVHDPIVALAYVSASTERARLGIAVVNAPFYAPILLAKQIATLDEVSGGRLDVGLGLGWAPEEFAAVGVPYERRGARVEDFVACLTAIWGPDPVQYDGPFYTVPPALVDPKPVQAPHPPLLLGGSAPPALRRVGRIADGWISASRHDLRTIARDISMMKASAAEVGRDPEALRFVIRGVVLLDSAVIDPDGRRPLSGSAEAIRADLGALRDAGVTEVFLDLNFDPQVGSPDADPRASMSRAEEVLSAFAPARTG